MDDFVTMKTLIRNDFNNRTRSLVVRACFFFFLEQLEERDFEVNLRKFSNLGIVAFAFEGHVVFTCAAKNLSFLGCSDDDCVLVNKVIRLMEAEREFADKRRSSTLSDSMVFSGQKN